MVVLLQPSEPDDGKNKGVRTLFQGKEASASIRKAVKDAGDRLTQVTDTKGGTRDYEYDNANRNTVRKFSATGQAARLDLTWNNRDEVTELKRYSDLAGTNLSARCPSGH